MTQFFGQKIQDFGTFSVALCLLCTSDSSDSILLFMATGHRKGAYKLWSTKLIDNRHAILSG